MLWMARAYALWHMAFLSAVVYLLQARDYSGRLEPVVDAHSRDVSQPLMNKVWGNLPLHADHDARPSRAFNQLRFRPHAQRYPFGFETCSSVSVDHSCNPERLANGNKHWPLSNTRAADPETVPPCCTSGDCACCRDSQGGCSWLVSNPELFMESVEMCQTRTELAKAYYSQFTWSHYLLYRRARDAA